MDELFMEPMSAFENNLTLDNLYLADLSFESLPLFTLPSSVTSDDSKPLRPITTEQALCREGRQVKLSGRAWAAKQQEKRDRDSKASREYRAKKKHEFQVNKLRVSQLRH